MRQRPGIKWRASGWLRITAFCPSGALSLSLSHLSAARKRSERNCDEKKVYRFSTSAEALRPCSGASMRCPSARGKNDRPVAVLVACLEIFFFTSGSELEETALYGEARILLMVFACVHYVLFLSVLEK